MKRHKHHKITPFVFELVVRKGNINYTLELNRPCAGHYKVDYYGRCDNPDCVLLKKKYHGEFKCHFKKPGKYRISLYGTFPGFCFRDKIYSAFKTWLPDDSMLNYPEDYETTLDEFTDRYEGYYAVYHTDIISWGNNVWRRMDGMFEGCKFFSISASDAPDLHRVYHLDKMFNGCRYFNGNIEHWDVSSITSMYRTFMCAYHFNQPLQNWNVSNVREMSAMFGQAVAFNQPLNHWNVSKVESMMNMFTWAHSFNQPLDAWDVSHVQDMWGMFTGAESFEQNLENWNVSSVNGGECSYLGEIHEDECIRIIDGKCCRVRNS